MNLYMPKQNSKIFYRLQRHMLNTKIASPAHSIPQIHNAKKECNYSHPPNPKRRLEWPDDEVVQANNIVINE